MNGWPSGQSNGGMFQQPTPGQLNPASMYNGVGNGAQFDFSHGLPNGNSGTPNPSFPNQQQTFQPGSVVPAKRPHDGMSGSPVQQQAASRSQTPGFNFNAQQGGAQQFSNAPTPFSHLQQPGSSNATPSPTISNQQFRPPAQQQRMQNASPSPYVQQPQQQNNFGNQMSAQNPNQGMNLPQNQMGNMNQQFGMNANMNMQGQGNNMGGGGRDSAQRAYQIQLMQQQARMRGMMPQQRMGGQNNQMPGGASQQQMGNQMMNGQGQGQMSQTQMQRAAFLKTLAGHAQQQQRPFNPQPNINGKPVDLFVLWSICTQAGGSPMIDRMGQWQAIATKTGFPPSHFPNAAEELKQIYAANVGGYERMWLIRKAQQKQELARQHAHQMAGVGGPSQASPTRSTQGPNQQQQFSPFQQGPHGQQQPHQTPVQANASLPPNGMSTPQQQMMQHRRNSSVRRPEQMTPHNMGQQATAPSPHSVKAIQRSPSIKHEPSSAVMKSEEPQSSNYVPAARSIESDGGYDVQALSDLGWSISMARPDMPTVHEMGFIDIKAIKLSLASGIHSEVRYALDTLTALSNESAIQFDLGKCEDLIDVIIDCAEEQIELLSEEAVEVSDALDLPSYEDVVRGSRIEAESLQEIPPFGSQAYELDRAADKLIAIAVILRNFSFFEHNHPALTSSPLTKWLSNTIRLLGTRNMLLRTFFNAQDFYKDMITFLSNITQSLELPSRDDALHVLHFLLAFAPQPAPSYTEGDGHVRFTNFLPAAHRYLPPAVDCLAKLLARQDPNRQLYRSIFTASSSSLAISESPLDLLTRAFALAISVLPDRSKGALSNSIQLRIVEVRKAYITQGMLAADILTTLLPSNETDVARAWIESEDGWAVGLLNLAALLSVDRSQMNQGPKGRELSMDTESFKLITHRALTMMKRLAEKAGKGAVANVFANGVANGDVKMEDGPGEGEGEGAAVRAPKWEGIPQAHGILGALMIPQTDKVALGLLCGLHEMAMQGS